MARLSLYLPPFAGDYSGACSTLFGLDCLVVILDAGCCTHNYVDYDEFRWGQQRKSAFSAQLRTVEAVLGDDERILEQAIEAAEALQPACIALVGTPVPAIVGMDIAGMAYEIESRCGVPTLGLPTTGFETYEHGVSLALEELCRRFAVEKPQTHSETSSDYPCVNLIGVSPHDFMGDECAVELEKCVEQQGFHVAWSTAGSYDFDDIAAASSADASLVVSWSGLAAARLLRDRFGVPFTTGFPAGSAGVEAIGCALRAVVAGGNVDVLAPQKESLANTSLPPVVVVGDQVAANAVRNTLRACFAKKGVIPPIPVASFFSMEQEWMEAGDMQLKDETDLIRYAEDHPNLRWVGDPLLCRIPALGSACSLKIPHEALSSALFKKDALLPGSFMDTSIDIFVESCMKTAD